MDPPGRGGAGKGAWMGRRTRDLYSNGRSKEGFTWIHLTGGEGGDRRVGNVDMAEVSGPGKD